MKKVLECLSITFWSFKFTFKNNYSFIVITFIISILSVATGVSNLIFTKNIVNLLSTNNSYKNLFVWILSISIAIFLLNIFTQFCSKCLSPIINEKNHLYINNILFQSVISNYFEKFNDNKFFQDYYYAVNNAETSICQTINILNNFLTAILYSGTLSFYVFSNNFLIIIASIVCVFLSLLCNFLKRNIYFKYNLEIIEENRHMSYINRIFYFKDYAKEVRLYNGSTLFSNYYKNCFAKKNSLHKYYGQKIFAVEVFYFFVQTLYSLCLILLLLHQWFLNQILLGDLIVALTAAQQLNQQVLKIFNIIPDLYQNSLVLKKVYSFIKPLKYTEKVNLVNDTNISIKSYEMRDVAFHYNTGFFIESISFSLKKGDSVAILGENGSGKTTLGLLISNLYSPSNGTIFINQRNSNEYSLNFLCKKIGILFQDYKNFSFTIAENILMKPFSDEEADKVVEALKFVGLYSKVKNLPKGIHSCVSTEFSPEGIELSAGEYQKLAIARLYAQNYDIIVLDEFESSLDIFSKKELYNLIFQLAKDKILIVISHQSEIVSLTKKVIYLKNGKMCFYGKSDNFKNKIES